MPFHLLYYGGVSNQGPQSEDTVGIVVDKRKATSPPIIYSLLLFFGKFCWELRLKIKPHYWFPAHVGTNKVITCGEKLLNGQ
jgi:hypothetical protein